MLSACLHLGATQVPWHAGADAAQATVSDKLADTAIAAKHVSSAAAAAAFPQAYDERGETPVCPTDKPSARFFTPAVWSQPMVCRTAQQFCHT